MLTTLVMTGCLAARINELSSLEVESAAVILAHQVETPSGDLRLLAAEMVEVPDVAYERRDSQRLRIRSDGYVPALGLAEESGCTPIWFHTHPGEGSDPSPSKHDEVVNRSLGDVFRLRAGSENYGTLITSPLHDGLTFTGSIDDGDSSTAIDRLWIVGPRFSLQWSVDGDMDAPEPIYDRNVRAFGGPVQQTLGDLHVAVVGCGGTGSAVAEQLVRLGVAKLDLIDPDDLSASNVTRVYGSKMADVGRPKVEVLAQHLASVMPSLSVLALQASVTQEAAARRLLEADVVFGCTDDNAGRLVLSRLSSYFLTPVIDCGVLLSSDKEGGLEGINGRVTVLHPGQACLVCRGRIDLARARSEMLAQDELTRLVGEGYAPALPGVEPAVVAFTTAVAAAAVAELLERLARYGVEPVPSELLLRLHDREISTNRQDPRPRHYCDLQSGKLGLGLTAPFLEQTW